jgi:hypothetical protein
VGHDAGQKFGIGAGSELAWPIAIKVRWLHGCPVRDPERADASALIKNLGEMATLLEDGYAQ